MIAFKDVRVPFANSKGYVEHAVLAREHLTAEERTRFAVKELIRIEDLERK